jgi:hypothetical protein
MGHSEVFTGNQPGADGIKKSASIINGIVKKHLFGLRAPAILPSS